MIRITAVLLALTLAGCSGVLTATRETPMEPNYGTRTLGSSIDDQLIETRASVNIAKAHPDLEAQSRFSVTSYNGVVLLTGQVPRAELVQLAGDTARPVQRVKAVHNDLTVGPRPSLPARNNDAVITSSAKPRILADSTIPGRRIKVVTEAGAVYLMGLVTRAEADAAVAAVQQVGGVQRIVKLFEYIDWDCHRGVAHLRYASATERTPRRRAVPDTPYRHPCYLTTLSDGLPLGLGGSSDGPSSCGGGVSVSISKTMP